MSARAWRWLNLGLLIGWSVMLVICAIPWGPGPKLANSIWYLVFISHVALVLACMASISGVRSEEESSK